MARRRNRSGSSSAAHRRGGDYPPPASRVSRRLRPAYTPNLYLRTRARPLDHSVFASTVRSPLIRTVPRDTSRVLNRRRRSPDVPVRALARLKSVNPYMADLSRSWPAFSDAPLRRATNCAKRSIRREVLLAKNLGNGSGSRGIPKSKEKCK